MRNQENEAVRDDTTAVLSLDMSLIEAIAASRRARCTFEEALVSLQAAPGTRGHHFGRHAKR